MASNPKRGGERNENITSEAERHLCSRALGRPRARTMSAVRLDRAARLDQRLHRRFLEADQSAGEDDPRQDAPTAEAPYVARGRPQEVGHLGGGQQPGHSSIPMPM